MSITGIMKEEKYEQVKVNKPAQLNVYEDF